MILHREASPPRPVTPVAIQAGDCVLGPLLEPLSLDEEEAIKGFRLLAARRGWVLYETRDDAIRCVTLIARPPHP